MNHRIWYGHNLFIFHLLSLWKSFDSRSPSSGHVPSMFRDNPSNTEKAHAISSNVMLFVPIYTRNISKCRSGRSCTYLRKYSFMIYTLIKHMQYVYLPTQNFKIKILVVEISIPPTQKFRKSYSFKMRGRILILNTYIY